MIKILFLYSMPSRLYAFNKVVVSVSKDAIENSAREQVASEAERDGKRIVDRPVSSLQYESNVNACLRVLL